jgi:HEPN domain-containing protein
MRRAGDEFNAACYLAAAEENLRAAQVLLDDRQFIRSVYLYGVAVECMIMAVLRRRGRHRDDHHDVVQLSTKADFVTFFGEDRREAISASIQEVSKRWRNEHRYRSTTALRKHWTAAKLFRTTDKRFVRGDLVETQSRMLASAASDIVLQGIERWQQLERKKS